MCVCVCVCVCACACVCDYMYSCIHVKLVEHDYIHLIKLRSIHAARDISRGVYRP